ncbi:MAG: flagellar biosynthesis anti-sigma factor FlgM [Phycisphaerae bacterium]|nr:flagellar biosynthesis anti-sigma factor FlgM [Phycisphaerae bacterium]
MNDVNAVGALASAATLREFANHSRSRTGATGNPVTPQDRVEISELADFLSRLAELPEARARKIVEVRGSIASGAYETSEKLDLAVERLLDGLPVDF